MVDAAGKVFPVYNSRFELGTNGLENTNEQVVAPASLENLISSAGGAMGKWFAMDATGWTKVAMAGKKLSFSFKGKRSVGDPGNDYTVGPAWRSGQDVTTKFKWAVVLGATLACDVVVDVTAPSGRDTMGIDGLEFEAASYDKPTFAPAAPTV